jgi:hypothetical protein
MLNWVHEVNRQVNGLLGYPEGSAETYLVWFVAMFSLLVTMRCTCSVYRIKSVAWLRMGLALMIGIYSILGASALTSLYLLPMIEGSVYRYIAFFSMPILAFILIGVPVQSAVLRASFVQTFFAFASSVLVAIIAINFVHAGFSGVDAGGQNSKQIRSRSTNFEALLGE